MTWKNLVNPLAIRPSRKTAATAIVYGLSLAVRFTSAAGEETEVQPPSRDAYPITSIMINDEGRTFYKGWPRPAPPISFRNAALDPRRCSAECERLMSLPPMSSCHAP